MPPPAAPSTIRLHRVLRAPPERVYRAFLDPAAFAKWLPPHGFTCTVLQLDAKVGGAHRASFTNFGTGDTHSFGGAYLELKRNERIRYTDRFDPPGPSGEMTTTVSLKPVSTAPRSRSSRRTSRPRSRPRPATSDGRSRCRTWRPSWSRRSRRDEAPGGSGGTGVRSGCATRSGRSRRRPRGRGCRRPRPTVCFAPRGGVTARRSLLGRWVLPS